MRLLGQAFDPNQEHLAQAHWDAYQDGVLSAAEVAAYRLHLSACDACQAWGESQHRIAQTLRDEAPPRFTLSPSATAQIERKIAKRMRSTLIMSRMKTAIGAAVAIALLALAVAVFALQTKDVDTLEPAEETTVEATAAIELTEEGLFAAVRARDIAAVEQILEAGVSADITNAEGDPILKTAINGRDPEIVELLVAHGAGVNRPDASGDAMLPQAARMGNLEIVQVLIEAGADPDGTLVASAVIVGTWEAAALNWAAYDNRIEIAQYLVAHGADVNLGDRYYERTPLHSASYRNNAAIVTLLLENGADPNALSTFSAEGRPLHFAIAGNAGEAVEALLAGGAEVDVQTDTLMTPLMYVQTAPDVHSVSREKFTTLLLEAGADPNLQNNVGNTALHLAARWDRTDSIPALVAHGASLDVQNSRGQTPLDVANADRTIALLQELAAGQ